MAAGGIADLLPRPRPLDAAGDRGLSLQPVMDFGFARATNSVLLGVAEYPRAMRNYPIVFTSREPRVAVAVLGLEGNENLFIGEEGRWHEGNYVRRYPFIFLEQPGKSGLTFCVDEASGLLTQSYDHLLFEGGESTQLVRNALNSAASFTSRHWRVPPLLPIWRSRRCWSRTRRAFA
jgi:hypothetical protein